MALSRLPAVFMRGGTSKAVLFKADDLPPRPEWDQIFLSVMGSPDFYGRQLDGMGGGISSLSKVCVVGPPSIEGADVDYTFAQIPVGNGPVDYSGNCGNMSSAIGPFAVDERLVAVAPDGNTTVRIHNTNTRKIIVADFSVRDGRTVVGGEFEIDGVSGRHAPIWLKFPDPGGAGTGQLLPTDRPVDALEVTDLGVIEASLVDAANPCVFVAAASLGKTGVESPDELETDLIFMERMEAIRRAASVAMGISASLSEAGQIAGSPKVAMVAAPQEVRTLSGKAIDGHDYDIGVRMLSMGRSHRATPITGALCLAVAMRIPGSLPNRLMGPGKAASLRIAHPSGTVDVDASVSIDRETGRVHAESCTILRTARRLFEGFVYYQPSTGSAPR